MVVNAAFEIARNNGVEQVMVKNIADKIGCSVQPIYSYCKNMDGLRQNVIKQVNRFIQEFVTSHIDKEDLFRSTGKTVTSEYADLYDWYWHYIFRNNVWDFNR